MQKYAENIELRFMHQDFIFPCFSLVHYFYHVINAILLLIKTPLCFKGNHDFPWLTEDETAHLSRDTNTLLLRLQTRNQFGHEAAGLHRHEVTGLLGDLHQAVGHLLLAFLLPLRGDAALAANIKGQLLTFRARDRVSMLKV